MSAAAVELPVTVTDVSGQKKFRVASIPRGATVREFVQSLRERMGLVRNDVQGQPLQWAARLEREGRNLNESELVSDALQPEDEIVLAPRINAG